MKKIFHTNNNEKRAGEATLLLHKIDFKSKTVKRDKEGHYVMIKGSILQEDTEIRTIHTPNIRRPQYTKQLLRKMRGDMATQ